MIINPAAVLIKTILLSPTDSTPIANDPKYDKNPIRGYMIMANITIMAKFLNTSPVGLKEDSMDPMCNPEDNRAPKILTKSPLSPENNGTNAKILGLLKIVEKLLFKMVPAVVPNSDDRNSVGVLCIIIFLSWFPRFIP